MGSRRPALPAARRHRRSAPGHLARYARGGSGGHVRRRSGLHPAPHRCPRYWRNRGNGTFAPPHRLAYTPAGVNLGDPGVQLADLDGDGRPDLLLSTPERTGYWPLASNGGFDPAGYVPVRPAPTVSLSDPLVRLIDLNG